jgi:hypothetical protein
MEAVSFIYLEINRSFWKGAEREDLFFHQSHPQCPYFLSAIKKRAIPALIKTFSKNLSCM